MQVSEQSAKRTIAKQRMKNNYCTDNLTKIITTVLYITMNDRNRDVWYNDNLQL